MKLNALLLMFIFLLSGCGGSDAPSMIIPVDSDEDSIRDDSDATNTLTGTTERVSVASDGTQSNHHSPSAPAISDDGRYVVFNSFASNLVENDTNEVSDVFVRDRDTGITERISISSDGTVSTSSDGTEKKSPIYGSAISGDGRYVIFNSGATNLVENDTNEVFDAFVYDRDTGITERVSVSSCDCQSNNASGASGISDEGRYVVFYSQASNLVAGDTNGSQDVFVRDRDTGITERVSVASDGTESNDSSNNPAISGDGRYVVFRSPATNLVDDDTNEKTDIFVHDRDTGITEQVSILSSDGTESIDVIEGFSDDGRYMVFSSFASNLVAGDTNGAYDVFVHDRNTGITELVSVASDGTQGNNTSYSSVISGNGRYVTFSSWASNLVAGDTNGSQDVFLHDRDTGITERVSIASDGTQSNWGVNLYSAISGDGRHVAFNSDASNLVANDTNGFYDIFVHSRTEAALVTGAEGIDSP